MRRSLHKRTRQGLFPIVVKIGGKLTENLIISGWTFSGIGVIFCQIFAVETTCYFWAEKQIFFKQTEMFHEGRFLSQKESACQAFSQDFGKTSPKSPPQTSQHSALKIFHLENLGTQKMDSYIFIEHKFIPAPRLWQKKQPPRAHLRQTNNLLWTRNICPTKKGLYL